MSRVHRNRVPIAFACLAAVLGLALPALAGPLFPNPVYTVGFNPYGLGMADFNQDGFQDFVVANFGYGYDGQTGDVSLLMGHGDGTFSNETRISTSQHPSDALAADVDGDGLGDLILTYYAAGRAVLMRGLGNGTFGPEADITTGVARLRLADFNDDNVPDLLQEFASASGGFVALLGNGDGTFSRGDAVVPGQSYNAAAADLNGDGRDDVLVIPYVPGEDPHEFLVFLGAGDGTFTPAGSLEVGDYVLGASAADVDGDGREDLQVETYHYRGGDNTDVILYFSNGNGTFTLGPKQEGADSIAIVASDRNGDGIQDYVRIGTYQVTPYLGNGNRTYTEQPFFWVGSDVRGTQAADLDGDGRLDLAIMPNTSEAVFIFAGNAAGGFGPPVDATVRDSYLGGLVTDDFNGDGNLDMAAALLEQDQVAIKLGHGDGTFGAETRFAAGVGPIFLASADMNGDGFKDLVVTLRNWHSEYPDPIPPGSLVVLLGEGDGTFQPPSASVDSGLSPSAMHVADLDGDGTPDVLIANTTDLLGIVQPDVSYFHSQGDGTFAPEVRLDAGTGDHYPYGWTYPVGLASGDFDGDGVRDIVVSVSGIPNPGGGVPDPAVPGTVRILRGLGGGAFAPFVTVGETESSAGVAVSDLDGDGSDDIAVADAGLYISINRGGLYTLLNDGSGSFTQSALLTTGIGPFDVQVADMTGDGISDLVSSVNAGYLAILPGLGGGEFGEPINFGLFGGPLAMVLGDFDLDGLRDLLVISPSGSFILYNQTQGPPPLEIDASITFTGKAGLVTWTTNAESNLAGFNIVEQTAHGTTQINTALIPCAQCITGVGDTYRFFVPRHRSGKSLFIQAVYTDRTTELFGPPRRE